MPGTFMASPEFSAGPGRVDTGPSAGEGPEHREKAADVPRSLGQARIPCAETRAPKPLCPSGGPLRIDPGGRGLIRATLRLRGSSDTNPEGTHLGPLSRVMLQDPELSPGCPVPPRVRRRVASVRVGGGVVLSARSAGSHAVSLWSSPWGLLTLMKSLLPLLEFRGGLSSMGPQVSARARVAG